MYLFVTYIVSQSMNLWTSTDAMGCVDPGKYLRNPDIRGAARFQDDFLRSVSIHLHKLTHQVLTAFDTA
jgi:hypothetical protein